MFGLLLALVLPLLVATPPTVRTGECFVLAPLEGAATVAGGKECDRRTLPASTFKIPHALIALQTGVLTESTVMSWDGAKKDFPSWECDHYLESAIKSSVVWFFQRVAESIGRERELQHLKAFGYGSQRFAHDVDRFWLNGDLTISPSEQVAFLKKMYSYQLPVDRRHIDTVKAAMTMPPGALSNATGIHAFPLQWPTGTVARLKTGNGTVDGERVSWLLGEIESGGRQYVFASRTRSATRTMDTTAGADLAVRMLNALVPPQSPSADARTILRERVKRLTRDSSWTLVTSVPMTFRTFHPQGMVKIGDRFFISSVEVRNRDAGEGVGHLFQIDKAGHLIADLKLGEGAIYHPGGIDYDGTSIWVPVAEYRPNSRSIVYRVDPETMKATEVFRFADHIGAIVRNVDDHTLHGVSWGSRRFYRWTLGADGKVTNADTPPEKLRTLNTSYYLDYQDCKYVGARRMLCTGVTEMRRTPDASPFRLGGIDLIDLRDGRPVHQVPVLLWTDGGLDMTHNPVWLEPSAAGLRGYFMPEDDTSTLYIYDVQ